MYYFFLSLTEKYCLLSFAKQKLAKNLEKVKKMGLHEEPPKADDTTEKVDEEVPDEVEEQDEEDIDFDEDGNFSKSCDLPFTQNYFSFQLIEL